MGSDDKRQLTNCRSCIATPQTDNNWRLFLYIEYILMRSAQPPRYVLGGLGLVRLERGVRGRRDFDRDEGPLLVVDGGRGQARGKHRQHGRHPKAPHAESLLQTRMPFSAKIQKPSDRNPRTKPRQRQRPCLGQKNRARLKFVRACYVCL